MQRKLIMSLMIGIFMLFVTGCNDSSSSGNNNQTKDPTEPTFSASNFSNPTEINNTYLPMIPGTAHTYQAETEDGVETIVTEVLEDTRMVNGIECVVFHDRVFLDDLLIEDTHDWFAQDNDGNVWYMGEEVVNYEYDDEDELIETNNDGAWEAGVDGAQPVIVMWANPVVGESYQQEYYPGEAEDMARVEATGISISLMDGTIYNNCLKVLEWNPLEESSEEYKYYVPDVGLVLEEDLEGGEFVELKGIFLTGEDRVPDFSSATFSDPTTIDNTYLPLTPGVTLTYLVESEDETETIITEVLDTTRFVSGIECVVFRDRVYVDELLIEDTYDWFAQDDAGNVWYMGEEVVNYEYDDDDELIETNNDGAWEAGVDGALPGIQMWANPTASESYYQEYLEDEAEDMGMIVRLGVEVELEDGSIYDDCLQVLDWNPLEPGTLEYKFYAPGLGMIKEEKVGGDEVSELKGVFATKENNIPNFDTAVFSNPTKIDNTYFPLTPGTVLTYEMENEDETETVVTEVLGTTRMVNGVECVVFHDQVFIDEDDEMILIEDTHDWFAQDDAGNVWYMGEEVINYEYDCDGELIETNNDGSWEAGVDGALPGIQMWANPAVGDSYYQEYLEDEAEDMGMVVAVGVAVELADGSVFENGLQTLDWTPLEPETMEYKYYAPGVGFVKESKITADEMLELVDSQTKDPTKPAFSASNFSNPTEINNTYLPMIPGTAHTYQAETEDGVETIVTEVLEDTRMVNGIECVVFHDRVFLDDLLIEDTHDWFAQDNDGNVWYMGEEVVNYEYNDDEELIETNNDGAWEAGVAGAQPGIVMWANPVVGESYQQEYYPGEAEDMARVEATGISISLSDGTVYNNCLKILEWNPLEEGSEEYKYYVPNVGLVMEEDMDGEERVELKGTFLTGEDRIPDFTAATFSDPSTIDNTYLPLAPGVTHTFLVESEDETETIVTEVLDTTRFVSGIECAVFRDRVYVDELLIEDTYDWFAQDDAGNVWYMGEEVVNYEYDDEGELIETNNDGAWEAGVDGALPGIQMWANPTAGESYYQEYYEDEAEDMGMIVRLGVEVELEDGSIYDDCLQVLDWNPLEPGTLEYKFYAPGLGMIKEEKVGGDEVSELKGVFVTSEDSIPDFESAVFTNSTVIDNIYLPLTPGTILNYVMENEDETETVVTEVLGTTRMVNGVECVVFHDQVFISEDDEMVLIEDTHDWFAQDDAGNVWYMGEEVINYEYDDEGELIETNNDGAWEAGVDGAEPGIVMWANPLAGFSYYQEYLEEEAEDMGMVVAVGVEVELEDGTVFENCLQTLDWTPLEPETMEYKYYAPGVGFVKEEKITADEVLEIVDM